MPMFLLLKLHPSSGTTQKKKAMLSQESSPLLLPEILLHVYSYLDDPALNTCARVSHFWRRWSLHHRSASAFVPSSDILNTFARRVVQDDSSDEEKDSEEE